MSTPKITFDEVIAASGVHPKILEFARWFGFECEFQHASSDMTLEEQAARLFRLYPEMDRADVVLFLGDCLRGELDDWFSETYPIVGVRPRR